LLEKVEELISPITGTWDEQLVPDTFLANDAEMILKIYQSVKELMILLPGIFTRTTFS
jgi:hypothetical protein